jgi:hypothetical protein
LQHFCCTGTPAAKPDPTIPLSPETLSALAQLVVIRVHPTERGFLIFMRSRRVILRLNANKIVGDPKRYAALGGYLLTPVALAAYVMAFWRVGADMNWLNAFVISKGLLSRWQVWMALAVLTQVGAHYLNRSARPDDTVTP